MLHFLIVLATSLSTIVHGACVNQLVDFSQPYQTQGLLIDYGSNNVAQANGALQIGITEVGGTRVSLNQTLQYGSIEVKMKAAAGSNIVSSFILMADNGDEIDFEFVGKDPKLIQTNFFYKGVPIYDKNAKFYATQLNLTTTFNVYVINWTKDYYEWLYNGYSLRKLYRNQTSSFPDSPSKVQFGIWRAQNSNWAGNGTNWSQGPFFSALEYIKVSCNVTTLPKDDRITKNNRTEQVLPNDNDNQANRTVTLPDTTNTRNTPVSYSEQLMSNRSAHFMMTLLLIVMLRV